MRELRHVAEIALPRDGHTIECVEDGSIAWKRIAANPSEFDVVMTDHHMPNMNGLELVRRLRTVPFRGKIVVFSSELSPEVNAAYVDLAVDKLLHKPVLPSELRHVLAKL